MGISGKPEELINQNKIAEANIPIIKRFSGGGTVVVDENTLFVTFIFAKERHAFNPFPEPIMQWSADFYKKVFAHNLFALRENDYILGDKKCGGNAQYIKKERWLHHTSFLWDYTEEKMEYLLHPKKTPSYRKERPHTEFLCKLKDFFPSKDLFINSLKNTLTAEFKTKNITLQDIEPLLEKDHRKSTTHLTLKNHKGL